MMRALVFALLLVSSAYADDPARLIAAGKYDEAIAAGSAQNTAVGFSLAARAALTDDVSRNTPCLACLERAEGFARRAVAADPNYPEGQIDLAVSLGLKTHIEGIVVAKLSGYPEQARRAIDAALAAEPGNLWALAARGGWNLEIVGHAGTGLADLLYGATIAKGMTAFAAAFKTAPDNIVLRYQYALTLADCDSARFRDEIDDALGRAANGKADTVYERLVQTRAVALMDLIKRNDTAGFKARVKYYQGYP
jgi:hypothetical protein